ncbi:MAG: DUF3592 domain-containing protein [Lachnospiraceae bacterium]|nr:DUF3592 domain-containing protein [Lachnospiraceae bacterium]
MSSRSQRNFQMQNWHLSSIVVGIILAVFGLYFIFGISRQTDAKNAKCTETTTGVISDVKQNGSEFVSTIDYTIEDFDKTLTVETKKDLGLGNSVEIRYEPQTWSHMYIEGISKTGKDDIKFGIVSLLAGGIFIVIGVIVLKKKKKARAEQ